MSSDQTLFQQGVWVFIGELKFWRCLTSQTLAVTAETAGPTSDRVGATPATTAAVNPVHDVSTLVGQY